MYYTGIAGEASADFKKQIEATKELGWKYIESRGIGDKNLSSIDDREFDKISELLDENDTRINCYASSIANWGKSPLKEEDFESSKIELENVLPRMQRLGIKMLRGMSFAVLKDRDPDSEEIRRLVFKKVKVFVRMCEDAGVLYLHENCMNYGGMSFEHTLRLIDEMDSPNFKLVFDTGNPVITPDRRGKPPYKRQSSYEFYRAVREHIYYVHIKDGRYLRESDGIFPEAQWTFPGEGDGDVYRIVKDLLKTGYNGGFSIEPHMTVVFHENKKSEKEKLQYENYIEYGKRFMRMVESILQEGDLMK